jgi:hypothetical protein
LAGFSVTESAGAQRRPRDGDGVVEERCDLTRSAVGIASDTKLNEQVHAVEISTLAYEFGSVEFEDQGKGQRDRAACRGKAAIWPEVRTTHVSFHHHLVVVMAERTGLDVEAHVWKGDEKFAVRVGNRIVTDGDLAGEFRSCHTGLEGRERRSDVVPVLSFEVVEDRRLTQLPNGRLN